MLDIWYRFYKSPFNGDEPSFFEVKDKAWARTVENRFPVIRQEVMAFIANDPGQMREYRFHQLKGKPEWQTFALMSWGYKHNKHIKKLPVTWNAFSEIEGLVSVSISRLTAGSVLDAHHGDTNAIYRCHLGIQVPGEAPECAFTVDGEERSWQEAKILAFCDAREHFSRNLTEYDRYVVIFDIIREEFLPYRDSICSTILATHILLMLDRKLKFYKRSSPAFLRLQVLIVSALTRFYLKLRG